MNSADAKAREIEGAVYQILRRRRSPTLGELLGADLQFEVAKARLGLNIDRVGLLKRLDGIINQKEEE